MTFEANQIGWILVMLGWFFVRSSPESTPHQATFLWLCSDSKSTYLSKFQFIEWHSMDDSSKTFCDPCRLVKIMRPYNSVQMSVRSICMTFLSNFSSNLPRWMWNTPFYESEFRKISLLPKLLANPWYCRHGFEFWNVATLVVDGATGPGW